MAKKRGAKSIREDRGEIVIYRTDDGRAEINLHAFGGTVWLNQSEIAQLFNTTRQNVNSHIVKIYAEGEIPRESVVKDYLTTGQDGKSYSTKVYDLSIILAVGYRVRSPRGTEFRLWATQHLSEYLVKGFVMNDKRLKDPKGWDYFDELLARIREIRASEMRFYQKVRDLFALSDDYEARKNEEDVRLFFANTQNTLLFAITGRTASELVVARADASKPNMNLMSWEGGRVRRNDIFIAKNYLAADEADSLNRLVVMFLDRGEFAVKMRRQFTLSYWQRSVIELLRSNGLSVLSGFGSVSHDEMKRIVTERYEEFDANRKCEEAKEADAEEIQELELLAKQLEGKALPKIEEPR